VKPILLAALTCALTAGAAPAPKDRIGARIAELASQIEEGLKAGGTKNTIAVLDFEDVTPKAKRRRLGRTFSDLLAAELSKRGGLELVERQRLDKVAAELKLNLSGAVDPATAKNVGKVLSVDMLLTGSVSELGDFYDVSVRVVSVEKGKVAAAGVVDIEKEAVDGAAPPRPTEGASPQVGLDLLEAALMAYARGHIENFEVHWPADLGELVRKYLDRLPDAGDGQWVYDPKEGRVTHSKHPGLRPTMPRLKLQKLLDDNKRQALNAGLHQLSVAMKMYEAETGGRPRRLDDLRTELPNAFGGSWLYDPTSGEVKHSQFPDVSWKP
jgi:TolB-like protein